MNTRLAFITLLLALAAPSGEIAHAQAPKAAAVKKRKGVKESLTGQSYQDFVDGSALFNAGDPQGALLKYSRAYDASKEPRILYNMASCHQRLKHYVQARVFLRRYIDEASAAGLLDAKGRTEADEFLSTFDRLIGRVTVDATPLGSLVQLDDADVGTTPLPGPIETEEGSHRVRVTKPGHHEWSTTIMVTGGGQETPVHAKLEIIRHEGRLLIQAIPKDATVRVDNLFAGLGSVDRVFPSGPHHVTVSAKGWRTREFEAVLIDDQVRRFDVTLDAEPRSHVWAWVAAGAAVIGGVLVTSVVLANQHDERTRPGGELGSGSLPLRGGF